MARCAGLVCLASAAFFLVNFLALDALLAPHEKLLGLPTVALVKSIFWCVVSLCLVGGTLAVLLIDKAEWRSVIGVVAVVITAIGVVAYLVGSLYVFIFLSEQYNTLLRQVRYCC